MTNVIWNYDEEVFRGKTTCPECSALADQYIAHSDGGMWDTRTECLMCGFEDDYRPEDPHGKINVVKKIGLCEGRHPIKDVSEYVFEGVLNPLDITGLDDIADQRFQKLRSEGVEDVHLYVTGLTVALVAAINAATWNDLHLTLYHFDRDSGEYYPQVVAK